MNQSLYYRANYCIIVDITLLATATFLTLTFTWWGSLRVRKLHPPGTILAVDESNRKIIGLSKKQSILLCYFSTKLLNICFARLHVVLRVVLRCSAGLTKKQNWTGFNRENLGNQSLTFKSGTFPSVCFEERWHKTALFYVIIYIYILENGASKMRWHFKTVETNLCAKCPRNQSERVLQDQKLCCSLVLKEICRGLA